MSNLDLIRIFQNSRLIEINQYCLFKNEEKLIYQINT